MCPVLFCIALIAFLHIALAFCINNNTLVTIGGQH